MKARQRIFWILVILLAFRVARAEDPKQVAVSATPVPINLPSPLPFVTQIPQTTATATRTPTPLGAALLEALTEANVRAQPDTESERLGTIRAGDLYPVIGRYFRWYQFQYDQSPSGTGWVFDELVQIIGDENTITDLNEEAVPTIDPVFAGQTATLEAITQTPGGILTATAVGEQIPLPIPSNQQQPETGIVGAADSGLLPTFTFPPNVVALAPTNVVTESSGGEAETGDISQGLGNITIPTTLPPIAPILVLGLLGIIGLFISSFRR